MTDYREKLNKRLTVRSYTADEAARKDESSFMKNLREKANGGTDNSFSRISGTYLSSFIKNSKEFFDNADSDSKDIGYNNALSKYKNQQSQWSALKKDADNIRAYYNANKDKIGKEDYDTMLSYLDDFDKGSSAYLNFYKRSSDYYSHFKSEDDYTRYAIGWRNNDDVISVEKAGKRKDYYEANVAKAENLDKQITEKRKEISDIGGFGTGFWNLRSL